MRGDSAVLVTDPCGCACSDLGPEDVDLVVPNQAGPRT